MATVTPTRTDSPSHFSKEQTKVYSWTLTNANADGLPVSINPSSRSSVSVTGTFGGASIDFQGSNDGVNFFALNNLQGAALTFAAAALKGVAELPLYVRPFLTGGAASTVVVTLFTDG